MAVEIESGTILTAEQLKNHIKVYAGPGAGKTHFLVENVKNIVTTNPLVAQSRERKVSCITYTNAAVEEIARRLNRFSDSVEVFTIHGFIIEHIIKPFQSDLHKIIKKYFNIDIRGNKPITSQVEGLGILHGIEKEEIYKYILAITAETQQPTYSKKLMGDVQVDNDAFLGDTTIRLSGSKSIADNHMLPIKEYVWSVARKLTHNEILFFGYQILKANPTALYSLRVKFPYIFIDEFQDTNPLQTLLIKLIGKKSTIIGVIGDIAQSIYSFQGAKLSQFSGLSIDGERSLVEYVINGNRRSIENVVSFCNFLRQADVNVTQKSIRPYDSDNNRNVSEATPVRFLIGNSENVKATLNVVINEGGVVLTRAWAKAFTYIRDVEESQAKLLSDIYNSYYNTSIDIRAEITEINNVNWVRAFRFIFRLHEAYKTGSFIDALNAFKLYVNIDRKKLSFSLLRQIIAVSNDVFNEITDASLTVEAINNFNNKLKDDIYTELKAQLLGENFCVPIFDEYDLTSETDKSKKFIANLSLLTWATSFKLFTEVFSPESKYMTVHQAKGLEWNKVIVALEPNPRKDRDNTTLLQVYSDPQILTEIPSEEFVRMYYVACSRAKQELYIHLPNGFDQRIVDMALNGRKIQYEFIK